MAVCPVLFDEAYGEPGGPRLRATPFRSKGRRLQEEPEGQGLQKEPNEQITVQGASSNRLGTRGGAVRPREEDVSSPTSRGWGTRLEPGALREGLWGGPGRLVFSVRSRGFPWVLVPPWLGGFMFRTCTQ